MWGPWLPLHVEPTEAKPVPPEARGSQRIPHSRPQRVHRIREAPADSVTKQHPIGPNLLGLRVDFRLRQMPALPHVALAHGATALHLRRPARPLVHRLRRGNGPRVARGTCCGGDAAHPGAGSAGCTEPARDFRGRGRGGDSGRASGGTIRSGHLIGSKPVRLVLDTNLLVSGVIATGLQRRLLEGARTGEYELCTSEVLLAEVLEVLSRGKFALRLSHAGLSPQGIVDDLRRLAVVVSPPDVPRWVLTDPDDDHVIAAAVAGQADLIASGDKRDLLLMGSVQGIPIVTAREAVERLEARRQA